MNSIFLDLIKNKKVAIVGPSASLSNSKAGKSIDNFDVVIKINNYHKLSPEDYGKKVDILFHNFYDRLPTPSNELQNCKLIVQGHPPTCRRNIINYEKSSKTSDIPHEKFIFTFNDFINSQVDLGRIKSTGFYAICLLFNNLDNINKLGIFGVDFLLNKYNKSYTNKYVGPHDMRNELMLFKKIYREYQSGKIFIYDKIFKLFLEKN